MLKELTECDKNIREEMKAKWNKEKCTGNQQWREGTGIRTNDLEHKEEINIQPEQKQETRIQKNEDSIRRLWDISKCANIQIMPEGEEEEQEIENSFQKNNERKFLHLVKEIDIQVQEALSPKQVGHKEDHTKTHHN